MNVHYGLRIQMLSLIFHFLLEVATNPLIYNSGCCNKSTILSGLNIYFSEVYGVEI